MHANRDDKDARYLFDARLVIHGRHQTRTRDLDRHSILNTVNFRAERRDFTRAELRGFLLAIVPGTSHLRVNV